eukprot:CAMPEP_0172545538 /NCGR_PEP_ID=MMETSP1067-20121228/15441_1 /TAXON_ID=265564 ORGANISM="Thalassiosira punctigera, Strain Tpunct2005C2" /NCGR_SAMPLE_ID=MMETSP1067 /ASSEMBLY_ACC=CAM_ASM_000444 /LENGTH=57 /DNA_ID=CAMNT_0013332299 /DNA_START=61 /DNA_END=234 /DNA_ORIENTATION=-
MPPFSSRAGSVRRPPTAAVTGTVPFYQKAPSLRPSTGSQTMAPHRGNASNAIGSAPQ